MLRSLGATDFNAITTSDATSYFETVAPERLEGVLCIESDRMGFASPAITEERVASEQQSIRNETVQNRVDRVLGTFLDTTSVDLFPPGHPYADLGVAEEADAMRARDVRAFLASWYLPSNAILSIAAPLLDRDAVVANVERYFGPLSAAPASTRPDPPGGTMPNRWLVLHAPVPTTSVTFTWRTPPAGTDDDAALDLDARRPSADGRARASTCQPAEGQGSSSTFSARLTSMRQASTFERSAPRSRPGSTPARRWRR